MGIELARAFVTVRGDAGQVAADLKRAQPAVEAIMKNIGSIAVVIPKTDLSQLESGLKRIKPMMESFAKDVKAGVAAVLAPIGAAGTFQIFKGLRGAGWVEQTTIAFETMIGSAKEAQKTLGALAEFAAKTPFEMPEILQAARGLIQFGERGEELMETMRILGNAAAGTSSDFGMVALIFNQVRGVGKLLTQDFRQLATRGIISLQDIADYFGVTRDAAQEMLSEGKVGFEDLRNILKKLSEEGGRFHDMMKKQSTSFLGLLSTLRDNLNMASSELGKGLLPAVKSFVAWGIKAADSVRSWIGQNRELATSLAASVTLVSSLGAALLAGRIAARLFGISLRGALVGTGVGAALVAVGAAVGWLVERFQLFDKIGPMLDQVAEKFSAWREQVAEKFSGLWEDIRVGWQMFKDISAEAWEGIIVSTKEFTQSFSEVIDSWLGPVGEKIKEWFSSAKDWIDPWKDMFVDAFKGFTEDLDTMLGSWEGLRSGIIYYATQAKLGFQAIWESVKNWFKVKIEQMKGFFEGLWAKIFGSEEDVENVKRKVEQKLKKIEEEHQKRMAEIGAESLKSLKEWEEKIGKLPKLSQEFGKEWDKAKDKIRQQDFQKAMMNLYKNMMGNVGGLLSGTIGGARDLLSSLPGKASELATRMKGLFETVFPKAEEKEEEKEPIEPGRAGFLEYAKNLQDIFLKPDDAAKTTAANTERTAVGVEQMAEMMGRFLAEHSGFLGALSKGQFFEAGSKLLAESFSEKPAKQGRTGEKVELEKHTKLLQELIAATKSAGKSPVGVYGS